MFFRLKRAFPYEKRLNLPIFSAFLMTHGVRWSAGSECHRLAGAWRLRGGAMDFRFGNEKSRKLVKVCGFFAN
ncbi:hypothetical protein [Janthinobacterium sp. SUN137]|uniref:hypothetical protein n=1 Tax=Janthinobacterium sp. SUN137 TaxID=3014789 RepID=UPI002712D276|nr:hypothetical protein [Janthinobacterium sp. SUN137]MDO8040909.1 hypothetical protein [Janthinobacterium sp. SUN137]